MDKATLYSFLLTTIAGLSTIIGSIVIFIKNKDKNKIICSSLAFASAVMITVSFTDLIPESLELLTSHYILFFSILLMLLGVNIGFIISFLIDKYLPSNDYLDNGKLYRVGLISMLAIILHNIPEDCIQYVTY